MMQGSRTGHTDGWEGATGQIIGATEEPSEDSQCESLKLQLIQMNITLNITKLI